MDQDEQVREVYARFGLALYMAQVLEHALVNAMVAGRLPHRQSVLRSEIDEFMSAKFEATLGKLVAELGRYVEVPSQLSSALREALQTRNWLAHRYFRERAVQFMSSAGRSALIDELEEACEMFDAAEKLLDEVVRPIRERFRIGDEKLQEYQRRLLAEAGDG